MKIRQSGMATLLVVLSVLAIAALVLLFTSRHTVVQYFNAHSQHRYHQALGYAEEGMAFAAKALGTDNSRPASAAPARYTLAYQDSGTQLRVISTGHYDGYRVSVQQLFAQTGTAPPPVEPPSGNNVLQLHDDLKLGGDITILGGKDAVLRVDGDVDIQGSIKGVDTLLASGDITLRGNQTVNTLGANGNISLDNGRYQRVSAMGQLKTSGNAQIVLAQSNGKASIGGSRIDTLKTIGDVAITSGGSSLGSIATQGSVESRSSQALDSIKAEQDLTIDGWGGRTNAIIGGTASYNRQNNAIKVQLVPGLQVPITPLTAISLQKNRVDANDYLAQSNYLFRRSNDGKIQIQVRAVNGIADGIYQLGSNSSKHENYLCRETDGQGRCSSPTVGRLCRAFSDYNECLTLSSAGTWQLNGKSMAPGVLWFDGDVQAGNGTYYNSLIASGNIQTVDNHQVYAVNYIGYPGVCNNRDYPDQYPSNYCAGNDGKLVYHATGNIAYLAGHYEGTSYRGGNITLGSSNTVHGNVIAGNKLVTGGRTVIKGYVTAANQGGGGHNDWHGNTTIDLVDLPDSFRPGDQGGTSPEPPPTGGNNTYQVLPGSWIDSGLTP